MTNSSSKEEKGLTINSLYEIPVKVSVVLGKTHMQIDDLLKLGKGSVVELDKKVGEPVDVCINDKIVAKGEIVIVDNKIGVTLTELVGAEKNLVMPK
jgi:flagellar motor switch protein FliN/FliY